MGVVPEEKQEGELDFLSPSLFSLHDQGEGVENLTSLPSLLKSMPLKDQQYWLDLIMEAAGVNEQSEKLEKVSWDWVCRLEKEKSFFEIETAFWDKFVSWRIELELFFEARIELIDQRKEKCFWAIF